MWKVAAASVAGRMHLDAGARCQDAHAWACEGPWLVAAVSDGAGIAARAREGAEHGVRHLVASIATALAQDPQSEPTAAALRPRVADAIRELRASLTSAEPSDPDAILDYAATILGIVVGPAGGLFFHIGDGMGLAFGTGEGATQHTSHPENGAHPWETYFFTDPDWEAHLRFTDTDPEVDQVLLMTDGAVALTASPAQDGLDLPFRARLTRDVGPLAPRADSAALAALLSDPETWTVTADDKTVLWARRAGSPDRRSQP